MNQKDKSLISKVKGRCFYCSNDVLKNRKCISLWKLLIGQKLLYRIAIVIIFAKIDRFSVIGHCETRIYSHTELKLYFLFSKEVVQSVNKTTTPRQIFVIYIYDAAIESTIFNKNNLYFYFPVKSFFFKQLSRPFRGYHKEFYFHFVCFGNTGCKQTIVYIPFPRLFVWKLKRNLTNFCWDYTLECTNVDYDMTDKIR